MKEKHKKGDLLFVVIVFIALAAYSISIIIPLLWGINTSLKSNTDFFYLGNVLGFPDPEYSKSEIRFFNYGIILRAFNFKRSVSYYSNGILIEHETSNNMFTMFLNTLIYAGIGSILQAVVPAIMAYACTKFRFRFNKIIYGFALFVMIMPIVGAYPSEIAVLRALGIYDTYIGYFVQKMSYAGMYFFVFYAFYSALPDSFIEAAEVDGASQLKILTRIILPLSMTMLSSVILIKFVHFWNDYQTALIYMPTKPTLAYGVYYMANIGSSVIVDGQPFNLARTPIRVASCMMLAIPILILFVAVRNKLMGNLTMGGIKG